jgi:phage repressor protein C with HTH and peptisase S24 domain
MVPALRHGDAVIARRGDRSVRPGQVVVARFRSRPDLLVVKRVVCRDGDGWWIEGDNPYGSDDSRAYGPADVVGRVLLRYWPRPGGIRAR